MSILDGATIPEGTIKATEGAGGADLLGTKPAGEPVKKDEIQAPEWTKGLPESLRSSKSLYKFPDGTHVENLAKSYVEAEKKLGRSIELPGKDATDEDRAKFFSRIGRPQNPDDYELTVGDPDLSKALRKVAFESGLTKEQLKAQSSVLSEYEAAKAKLASQSYTEAATKADRQLREEYGAQYDIRMEYAKKGFEELYSPELRAQLSKAGITNSPEFIRVMSDLGSQLREASLKRGAPSSEADQDPYVKSMAYLKNL